MSYLIKFIFNYRENFYKSWFNIIDGFIIVLSFIINVLLTLLDDIVDNYKLGRILIFGRIIRFILLIRSVRLLLLTDGFQRSMVIKI